LEKIDRPIFILGVARTGTTIIYQTLAKHPELAYFCTAWKKKIPLNFFRMVVKHEPTALEGWVWHYYKDLVHVKKVDENEKKRVRNQVSSCLRYWKRERFINKNPPLSLRIKYLNRIFPDCIFLIVGRKHEASIKSIHQYMLKNWDESNSHTEGWKNVYEIFGKRSKSKLHAVMNYYKYHINIIGNDLKSIPDNRKKAISYESFCRDPRFHSNKIWEFCDLSKPKPTSPLEEYEKNLPNKLENMNDKYNYADKDQKLIDDFVRVKILKIK